MAVQETTSSINVLDNSFQSGVILNVKAGIGFTVESSMSDYSDNSVIYGPAANALDLDGWEISDKEHKFLLHTRLHEMLENHGLLSDTL